MSRLSHDFVIPVEADPSLAPEVSVVMPVYNAAATLRATVASVLAQRFAGFELVAIDDGSTDDSLAVLLDLAADEPRLRVIAKENGGVSAARNLGVELARGELIAFLDADDLWDAAKLGMHLAAHRDDPALAGSYARIAFIAEDADGLDGARTHSSLSPAAPRLADVLGEFPVCTASNLVVRRDWFLSLGGFDPALSFAEDQDLVARLVARGGRIEGIDAVLAGYRFSPDGLSMELDRMRDGWARVARRHLAVADTVPLEAVYCRYLARRALRSGATKAALRYVATGMRLSAPAFLAERRRGLATIMGAVAAPLLPAALRLRLFA